MGAWYATRGAVARTTDVKASAYANESLDRHIEAASASVDRLCHRGARDRGIPGFAPWTGELTFDWPNSVSSSTWSVGLGPFALQLLTSLTSGGVTIDPAYVYLEPYASGPPYYRVTLNRSGLYVFGMGNSSGQRSLTIGGTWAAGGEWFGHSSWEAPGSMTDSVTSVRFDAPVDVGHLVAVDGERMFVTERTWLASGQTGTLASQANAQTLAVSDGSVFFLGEEIMLDAERMLIRDIADDTLIVQRATGGSALAAHTTAAIQFSRTYTVQRGVLGTTAAAHSAGSAVSIWIPPSAVQMLTIAYAQDSRAQESSGYSRTIGSGEGERQFSRRAIAELEDRVRYIHGRNVRMRSV